MPKTITVPSGNLFAIAARHYGDATLWAQIAAANGLSEPMIAGPLTLTLPDTPVGNGGILIP